MSARSAETSADLAISGDTINRAPDGLFYVKASLSESEVSFLVDTGASHVILSHEAAQGAERIENIGHKGSILTAGGPAEVDWVILEELELQGFTAKQVRAAVPRKDIGVSLLGQNVLAQFSQVNITGDQLTLVP